MQKYKVYINNEHKEVTDNWDEFCSKYTFVEAAGGVVSNWKNENAVKAGNILASANRSMHNKFLKILNPI